MRKYRNKPTTADGIRFDSKRDTGDVLASDQQELDMAAVYSEALKAIREASHDVGDSNTIRLAEILLLLKAANHLLQAASGPEDGPTSWICTRIRWEQEYKRVLEKQ